MSEITGDPGGATSDRQVDVRYYLEVVWRGRVLIGAAAVLGLAFGLLAAFLQTKEYRASSMVQIEPPTPTFLNVTDALVGAGSYWQNTDYYNTQFKILVSKALGEKVVERLKLKDRPPFKDVTEAGALLMSHVTIEPITESRLVNIQVVHEDPQTAALWANAVAEVYIDHSIATRVDNATRAYEWIQKQLANTQTSMRDAQEKLLKGMEGQDLFVPDGSISAVSTSITKLNENFIETRKRGIVLASALKQIEDMRRANENLETLPQVAADPLFGVLNSQLAGFNLDLSRLKEKFKEQHPEVQKIQAQIEQTRKARDGRVKQIAEGLRAEYAQVQKQEGELRAAIDGQKSQAATQSRKSGELEALKKEADSAKNLYEVLLQKLNETNIASSIHNNNVSLVEKATAPSSPIRPDKRKIAAVGLLFGLALGVGLVLARDYFDNTLKDPDEVERYLHLDLLAAVPQYEEANVHLVTEAYQNLRTALIFGRKDEAGQVVLITGTAPQEGKTTTLVNIAKLLASSGEKTVVLDFDLRRAQLHHRLGLTREPGLTNFFVKHEDLDTLIRPTKVPNLYALTAGPLPPNPPAILARKNVTDFLDHLRREFEWILVDSPPLASVTDALLLARHCDLAVMVIQHNKVDKKVVKRMVAALRKATPNVLGAVLNAVDVKSKGYYYYYYHHDQDTPTGEKVKPGRAAPVAKAL